MLNKSLNILFITGLISLSSCSLLKRDRVTRHNGIQRSDFDLPVFLYPAPDSIKNNTLVLILSGDGGWVDFEDEISLKFSSSGFNTIGFNSRDYFWAGRTPRKTADDLSMLLMIYVRQYRPEKIILCGYSFGADVIPFVYNRLHPRLKSRVAVLGMLSPFATSDFKVRTSDLLNIAKDNKKYKVKMEVDKVKIPIYCFYGQDEDPRALEGVLKSNFYLKLLPGDHTYDQTSYNDIINTITKGIHQK
ncbi:MAG: hypothetical protein P0Y49_11665 [Candidatus Pedobacter colombiensis]|uniref:Bacterial virulence domain-containing protein n=1 Tax=Candidatus Pedobacter colombiensis TaxID=3121371 RepID=A0AAJ5W3V2_9SPHI|nr:AcvB/VirJ family lysyl-phosphatidylglycerol hydrolase [Pedobacter sp.]WEK17452.1 MAG: hypothetical protein P0Y49_11665 [Pedobacter sp.]